MSDLVEELKKIIFEMPDAPTPDMTVIFPPITPQKISRASWSGTLEGVEGHPLAQIAKDQKERDEGILRRDTEMRELISNIFKQQNHQNP